MTGELEALQRERQRIEDAARLAHAHENKALELETNMVPGFASAAMRAPAIAAAGGIAAILGFYSANAEAIAAAARTRMFNDALMWFFISVLACVLAPSTAYFSQTFFSHGRSAKTHHLDERPFVRDTRKSKTLRGLGIAFQVLSVVLVAGSIGALIAGGWMFLQLLSNL